MPLKILADESVDYRIIVSLRDIGYTITSVVDSQPGLSDYEIVKWAQKDKLLILTEDRDFGELVFSQKMKTGVLYLRYHHSKWQSISKICQAVIEKYMDELYSRFTVVTEKKIRTREI